MESRQGQNQSFTESLGVLAPMGLSLCDQSKRRSSDSLSDITRLLF